MKLPTLLTHPVIITAIGLILLTVAAPYIGIPMGLVTQISIYVMYGAGVNLLLAYGGLGAFGSSLFFGVASYATSLFMLNVFPNEIAGLAFTVVASLVFGLVVGAFVLRRRGLYFSLLTLALSQLAFEIAFKWTDLTGGENGLQNVPRPLFTNDFSFHIFVVASVVAVLWGFWALVHAPFGRVLQAIRDNEQRVQFLGYNTYLYKLVGFAIMAVAIGYAGGLLALLLQGAYANNLGWQHAGDALLMTILGGVHHFLGPLVGAAVYLLLVNLLSQELQNWWLVFAPIIVLFILLAPEGLIGLAQRAVGRERWTLVRCEIMVPPAVIEPLKTADVGVAPGEVILSLRGISKKFGALEVAKSIDLDIRSHQLHSLIGPNGAGKTTLFNMITGILPADAGTITFAGHNITHMPVAKRVRLGMARSFQIMSVFKNLTAFDSVYVAVLAGDKRQFGFFRNAYRHADLVSRTWSVLNAVGLVGRANDITRNLSHGEQRLLEIALTLATSAKVLMLDEPLAGLATADRETVGKLVRQLAKQHPVLLIEHDMDRVMSLSDRISVLHQGQLIADGAPDIIAQDPRVIEAYLGKSETKGQRPVPRIISRVQGIQPVLRIENLQAGYDGSVVLNDLSLEVMPGEVVALLGRNGVGKTTTQRAIMGAVRVVSGHIYLDGKDITRLAPHEINQLGIAVVPEGRRLFTNLTVWENLKIAERPGGATIEEIFEMFPRLGQRRKQRAASLSGGERQIAAVARAMMAPSRLILLDEPFEGLSPVMVDEVMEAVRRLGQRVSMLIVEHKAELVLPIVDRAYILVNGKVAYQGSSLELHDDEAAQTRLLGVGGKAA